MARRLGLGDSGLDVQRLQELLRQRGYPVAEDGGFGEVTRAAVCAFQSQHLGPRGEPLGVDGVVGPLTWWSLTNPEPVAGKVPPVDFTRMPLPELGGSVRGRRALEAALGELAREPDEAGSRVREYLRGLAPEGHPWSAAFVSWCFWQDPEGPAFPYSLSAEGLFGELGQRGWVHLSGEPYVPQPGDIVAWSRGALGEGDGRLGLVHHVAYGMLYTVEGHRGPRAKGCCYVLNRMDRLLGYAQVPGP